MMSVMSDEPISLKPKGGKCFWCGEDMFARRQLLAHKGMVQIHRKRIRTRDHFVAKSKGGRKTVPACAGCNELKADMDPVDFRNLHRPEVDLQAVNDLKRGAKNPTTLRRGDPTNRVRPTKEQAMETALSYCRYVITAPMGHIQSRRKRRMHYMAAKHGTANMKFHPQMPIERM